MIRPQTSTGTDSWQLHDPISTTYKRIPPWSRSVARTKMAFLQIAALAVILLSLCYAILRKYFVSILCPFIFDAYRC